MTIFTALFQPLRKLSGFTLSVLLTTVVSAAGVILLGRYLGDDNWGLLAQAQTIAQLPAVLIAFGWGAVGAAEVASLTDSQRGDYYRQSLRARSTLFLIVVPVTAIILFVLQRGDAFLAILGAFAYCLPALSGIWFFTGIAQPTRLFLCDTVPVLAGLLGGIVAAMVTQDLHAVLTCHLAGYAAAVFIDSFVIMRSYPRSASPDRKPFLELLMAQRHAVSASAVSAFYVSLPMFLVGWLLPESRAVWGMADRLFRYASVAMQPFQQYFQGWVPSDPSRIAARARIATWCALAISVIGGACIAFLSPPISAITSIAVPFEISLPLGFAFLGVGMSIIVGLACLVAVGQARFLAWSTIAGLIVGAPLMLAATLRGSLLLLAIAMAITEIVVALVQIIALWRTLRNKERRSDLASF